MNEWEWMNEWMGMNGNEWMNEWEFQDRFTLSRTSLDGCDAKSLYRQCTRAWSMGGGGGGMGLVEL